MAACTAWPDGIQLLQLKAARLSGCYGACVTCLCRVLASQLTLSHTRVCLSTPHCIVPFISLLSPSLLSSSCPPLKDCPPGPFFPFSLAGYSFACHHRQAVMLPQLSASHCILGTDLSMLLRPSGQPGASTFERKATFCFHSSLRDVTLSTPLGGLKI